MQLHNHHYQHHHFGFETSRRNVVAHVRNRYPSSTLFAAGWSLGANIMTRYLGGWVGGWCGSELCGWQQLPAC
jgi:predicted alpha/beta-fold hydrolase